MDGKKEYAVNLNTNRLIDKSTAKYRKLKKLGQVQELEREKTVQIEDPKIEVIEKTPEPEIQSSKKDEYSEEKLQKLLISKSTDIIQDNLNSFVNTAKLTDQQLDSLVKKMLYEKLMNSKSSKKEKEKPKTKKEKKKKSKFKLRKVESSSSESSGSE